MNETLNEMGEEYRPIATRTFKGTRKVGGCARCGDDHEDLDEIAFWRPSEDADGVWRWWATCPTTGDPILIGNRDDIDEKSLERLSDIHVLRISDEGWTIQHPLACRPNLFECESNRIAPASDLAPGYYTMTVDESGEWDITPREGE